jgi:PAS domain S-box-containing protein
MFLQMQQSESRLRAIADTAVDGMVMIDAQGRVQSFNAAAERILGWRPEDVVGQNVSILMPEPDRSRHDTYIQRYLQGQGGGLIGGNGREVLALRPDGSTVPIRISIGRVPLDGDPVFVGFINDLTQRRAMEQELQASERACARSCQHTGRHLPLPLRRRLDHAVHQRCGDRTHGLVAAGLSGRPCRFTQLTLPEEVDACGRKSPRPSRSTDLTSWSLACGTATGDCAGCGKRPPVVGDDGQCCD